MGELQELLDSQDVSLVALATDLNALLENGLTLLAAAVQLDNPTFFAALLAHGADPNLRSVDGTTALTDCSRADYATLLADHGASVRAEQPLGGLTSVHLACQDGRLDVLRILVERCHGSEVLEVGDILDQTPLDKAVLSGRYPILEYLLALGVDLNRRSDGAWARYPLQHAALDRNQEMVEWLVARGADRSALAFP